MKFKCHCITCFLYDCIYSVAAVNLSKYELWLIMLISVRFFHMFHKFTISNLYSLFSSQQFVVFSHLKPINVIPVQHPATDFFAYSFMTTLLGWIVFLK